jgi:dTDP-4-dehydrorhamnose reductase
VRQEGADIRAVTIWALLGIMDWNTLLTRRNGFYEAGAFDKRSDPPRPTALAKAAATLAAGESFDHPVLDSRGWWWREGRHYMQPKTRILPRTPTHEARKLLIAGGTGTLGQALSRICDVRGLPHVLLSRPALDITDAASIRAALDEHRPWAVINAAGFVDVARAEQEAGACMQINVHGAIAMAGECARLGVPLVSFSSDLVFDGTLGRPYLEGDRVNPTGVYGLSKAKAEHGVAQRFPDSLIVRTSAFFGPWDRYNFVHKGLSQVSRRHPLQASNDIVSPTYVPDLAHVVLELLIDGSGGIWHLANPGSISWFEFARRTVAAAGYDPNLVEANGGENQTNTSLATGRGILLPPLESAIDRYFRDCPRELLPGMARGARRQDALARDKAEQGA